MEPVTKSFPLHTVIFCQHKYSKIISSIVHKKYICYINEVFHIAIMCDHGTIHHKFYRTFSDIKIEFLRKKYDMIDFQV